MSLKLKRYASNESEFTRTGRNKATFDIPASVGVSDLTNSRLVLDMRMDVTDSGGVEILYPATFGVDAEMVGPKSLLRNSKVKSRQHGLLNERRHINVVDSNLDWYGKHRDEEDAESLFGNTTNSNYGIDQKSYLPDNPWLMINRPTEGQTLSTADFPVTKRRAEIPIPMRHIDQLASIKQFPNVALGELRYEVEFEDQFNVAAPVVLRNRAIRMDNIAAASSAVGSTANPFVASQSIAETNRIPRAGDVVEIMFSERTSNDTKVDEYVISAVTESAGNYEIVVNDGAGIATTSAAEVCEDVLFFYDSLSCSDVAAAAVTGTTLGDATTPITLELQAILNDKGSHHGCPYYPGQPVLASCVNDSAVRSQVTKVATVGISGDKFVVTLDTPITVVTGNDCENVRLANRDWNTNNTLFDVTWTIDEAYLELAEIQLSGPQKAAMRKALENLEIPWIEHRMLQKDMPATSVHTDVVHAEPGCIGLAVLTPQNLRLLSGWDNCERYRFAINGVSNTNRDIHVYDAANPTRPLVGRQLHNHMLRKYLVNVGKSLKKYDANVVNYTAADDQRLHSMFPLVTPQVGAEQIIQIQLFADNGNMSQKSLFYVMTHPRVMKISNGRVTMM